LHGVHDDVDDHAERGRRRAAEGHQRELRGQRVVAAGPQLLAT
jgi:hypothetical protein